MKIVFAVHTYYPERNGVQAVTQYLAEGLARRQHDVLVITEKKELRDEEFAGGVLIKRISVKKKGFSFTGDKKKYLEYIQKYDPDVFVCVCTQSWTFDWIADEIETFSCTKILYTHGFSSLQKKYPLVTDLVCGRFRAFHYHYYWKRYYDKAWRIINKFDIETHLSENNISVWYSKEHGILNGVVMENAVEDIFFEMNTEQQTENIQYIYIANYDDNKNQKMVLNSFLKAKVLNGKLILAGAGEKQYFEELKNSWEDQKQDYPLANVEILYNISRNQVYKLYQQSQVFVCGSRKEQYPIMLCEAAAAGLAIISTKVGHAETVPGIETVDSETEMIDKIKWISEQKNERKQKSEQLRAYAKEHYRIKGKIDQFLEIINNSRR